MVFLLGIQLSETLFNSNHTINEILETSLGNVLSKVINFILLNIFRLVVGQNMEFREIDSV